MKEGKEKILNWDPFKVKQSSQKLHQMINKIAILGIGLIILALLLWIFLALISDRNAKLRHYKKNMKTWDTKGGYANFSETRFLIKIMPSEQTAKNVAPMDYLHTSSISSSKINKKYNYSQAYHQFNETTNYFTTLRLEEENIPVGTSETFCMHLQWTQAENEYMWDLYESVLGYPVCKNSLNDKFYWHPSDPKTGVDIKLWNQHAEAMECQTKEECKRKCDRKGGMFKKNRKSGPHCYTYDVLNAMCMVVYQDLDGNWAFKEGCYKDGSSVLMKPGKASEVYKFQNLSIQVRSRLDPFTVAAKETDGGLNFGMDLDWIYNTAFFVFFVGLVCVVLSGMGVVFKSYFAERFKDGEALSSQHSGRSDGRFNKFTDESNEQHGDTGQQ